MRNLIQKVGGVVTVTLTVHTQLISSCRVPIILSLVLHAFAH